MNTFTRSKRLTALAITLVMLLSMLPGGSFARASGCGHRHDAACGYAAASACRFDPAHSPGDPENHAHDSACGYAEGSPCGHACAEGEIAAFEAIEGEWSVAPGTAEEDLGLPAEVQVTYACGGAGRVAVVWTAPDGYDGLTEGEYTFTAGGDWRLLLGVDPPVITVTVTAKLTAQAIAYSASDIAALRSISRANGLRLIDSADPEASEEDPATWIEGLVRWADDGAERRVVGLTAGGRGLTGALDATGLTALKRLDVSENGLTGLTVRGLRALIVVDASGNALESADVQGCLALTALDLARNALRSVALGDCNRLSQLWLDSNAIDSLDISGVTGRGLYLSFAGNPVKTFKTGGGTASIGAEDLSKGSAVFTGYEASTGLLRFSATAGEGMAFSEWVMSNGAAVDAPESAASSVTLSGDFTITARFAAENSVDPAFSYYEGSGPATVPGALTVTLTALHGAEVRGLVISGEGFSDRLLNETHYTERYGEYTLDLKKITAMEGFPADGGAEITFEMSSGPNPVLTLARNDSDYDTGDLMVLRRIRERNDVAGQLASWDAAMQSGNWEGTGVVWSNETPRRVSNLDVNEQGLTGTLDVSGLTGLMYLYCPSNDLKALDVSGLTGLMYLYCSSNDLKALDVSGLTGLKQLYCPSNNLEALDVSGLSSLMSLYCSSNPITRFTAMDSSGTSRTITTAVSDGAGDEPCGTAYVYYNGSSSNGRVGDVSLTASTADGWSFEEWTAKPVELGARIADTGSPTTSVPLSDGELIASFTSGNAVSPDVLVADLNDLSAAAGQAFTLTLSAGVRVEGLSLEGGRALSEGGDYGVDGGSYSFTAGLLQELADGSAQTRIVFEMSEGVNPALTVVFTRGEYHAGDLAVLWGIYNQYEDLDWEFTGEPGEWVRGNGVDWSGATPKRVISLVLTDKKNTTGVLDVSGLTSLEQLDCSSNDLKALDVSGLSSLRQLNFSLNPLTRFTAMDGSGTSRTITTAVRGGAGDEPCGTAYVYYDGSSLNGRVGDVSLTASAANGWVFQEWTTEPAATLIDSTSAITSITLDGSYNVTANFRRLNAVEPDVLRVNKLTVNGSSEYERQVTLTAAGSGMVTGLIPDGGTPLAEGNQYTKASNVYTFDATFLADLTPGEHTITFNMIDGDTNGNPVLTLVVAEEYNQEDLAALREIQEEHTSLDWEIGGEAGSLTWVRGDGVTWTPMVDGGDASLRVTELYINGRKLSGTLDVSKLTALTYLSCLYNNLEELDVSGNGSLTSLYCSDNNLEELDVSGNGSLTSLYCYSNDLEELDVSGNGSLTSLDCSDNNLEELDVSGNGSLTSLYCSDNNLEELDVSGNGSLTSLYCYSNDLKELDVSENGSLTYLDCSDNNLKELDVGGNGSLIFLDCSDNNLKELDVSGNGSLISLNCTGNPRLVRLVDGAGNVLRAQSAERGAASLSYSYDQNVGNADTLTYTATPEPGWAFTGWEVTAMPGGMATGDLSKSPWTYKEWKNGAAFTGSLTLTARFARMAALTPDVWALDTDPDAAEDLSLGIALTTWEKKEGYALEAVRDSAGATLNEDDYESSPRPEGGCDIALKAAYLRDVVADLLMPDAPETRIVTFALKNTAGNTIELTLKLTLRAAAYDPGDVAAIRALSGATGLDLGPTPEDPATWPVGLVTWTSTGGALRATALHLAGQGLFGSANLSRLSRLTAADVSGNALYAVRLPAGLTALNAGDNRLSDIGLQGAAGLQTLSLQNNRLAALDVTGLTALTALHFNGNPVSAFTDPEGRTAEATADADGRAYVSGYDPATRSVRFTAHANGGSAFKAWQVIGPEGLALADPGANPASVALMRDTALNATFQVSNRVTPTAAVFDKHSPQEIEAKLERLAGGSLTGIALKAGGAETIVPDTAYAIDGESCRFKSEWLADLAVGGYTLVFKMSDGANPEIALTVASSDPAVVITTDFAPGGLMDALHRQIGGDPGLIGYEEVVSLAFASGIDAELDAADFAFLRASLTGLNSLSLKNAGLTGGALPEDALFGMTLLRSIDLAGRARRLGDSALKGCLNLQSVDLTGVESVGDLALSGCARLTAIEIPSATAALGASAFEGCAALQTAFFHGAPDIGRDAFAGCRADLTGYYLSANAANFAAVTGMRLVQYDVTEITPSAIADVKVGADMRIRLTANGHSPSLTTSGERLPEGLSLTANADGASLTGAAAVAGDAAFTLTAVPKALAGIGVDPASWGKTENYAFAVKPLSDDTSIVRLEIDGITLTLGADGVYRGKAPSDRERVEIRVQPTDANARVEMDASYPLAVGENDITVTVVAEDGTRRAVTIRIERQDEDTSAPTPSVTPTLAPTPTPASDAAPTHALLMGPVEGLSAISGVTNPGAEVTAVKGSETHRATADAFGFFVIHFKEPLAAKQEIELTFKAKNGEISTASYPVPEWTGDTALTARPVGALLQWKDEAGAARVTPGTPVRAEDFDENGELRLPLLIGNLYKAGEAIITTDGDCWAVRYALAPALEGMEATATLHIPDHQPDSAELSALSKSTESDDLEGAVVSAQTAWLFLEIELAAGAKYEAGEIERALGKVDYADGEDWVVGLYWEMQGRKRGSF